MSAAEVDALAARIEQIDEPTRRRRRHHHGVDELGLGAVLKKLIRNADVEGVRSAPRTP